MVFLLVQAVSRINSYKLSYIQRSRGATMISDTHSRNMDVYKLLVLGQSKEKMKSQRINCKRIYVDNSILLKMLEEGLHADITLRAQGGSVQAHRAVLACASPVFDAMFRHEMKEQRTSTVDIMDMSIEGLQLFLLMLYISDISNENVSTADHIVGRLRAAFDKHYAEVLDAVNKYQVLKRLYWILKWSLEKVLTLDNCWNVYRKNMFFEGFSDTCLQYMLRNYSKVIQSDSILVAIISNPELVQSLIKLQAKID